MTTPRRARPLRIVTFAIALPLLAAAIAGPASAHFHEAVEVGDHYLLLTLDNGILLAEERFTLRLASGAAGEGAGQEAGDDPDADAYGGKVWAWLPAKAEVLAFGPPFDAWRPPDEAPQGTGTAGDADLRLVGFDLAARNASLAAGEEQDVVLRWRLSLPEGAQAQRGIVYRTEALLVEAQRPLVVSGGPGVREADFGEAVVFRHPAPLTPPGGIEGWQIFAGVAVALLAGAWLWDRRQRQRRAEAGAAGGEAGGSGTGVGDGDDGDGSGRGGRGKDGRDGGDGEA